MIQRCRRHCPIVQSLRLHVSPTIAASELDAWSSAEKKQTVIPLQNLLTVYSGGPLGEVPVSHDMHGFSYDNNPEQSLSPVAELGSQENNGVVQVRPLTSRTRPPPAPSSRHSPRISPPGQTTHLSHFKAQMARNSGAIDRIFAQYVGPPSCRHLNRKKDTRFRLSVVGTALRA
jgi:hypothetical protein